MRTRYSLSVVFLFFFSNHVLANFQPQKLIEQWQQCQEKQALDQGCIKIGHKVLELKTMIESLEYNPQAFGLDIMKIQNQMAEKNISATEQKKLADELNLRLSIVGWLESPK